MRIPGSRHDSFEDALFAAADALRARPAGGCAPTLIVESPARAAYARRVLALEGRAFGLSIVAPYAWVRDRWELLGDGRPLVGALTRTLTAERALRLCVEDAGLAATPDTAALVAGLAEQALADVLEAAGFDGGGRADKDKDKDGKGGGLAGALSPEQRGVVQVLARYEAELRARGLCEPSWAAHSLAVSLPESTAVALVDVGEPPLFLRLMLDRLAARSWVRSFCVAVPPECEGLSAAEGGRLPPRRAPELDALLSRLFKPGPPLAPTGAVRFLLPSGPSAQPPLVAREAVLLAQAEGDAARREGREALPVSVAAADPLFLYRQLACDFMEAGVVASVQGAAPFGRTAVGGLLQGLLALTEDDDACDFDVSLACDLARNPLMGMPRAEAFALDAAWRQDRLATRQKAAADLSREGTWGKAVVALARKGDFLGVLDALPSRIPEVAAAQDARWRAEQESAASYAREAFDAATAAGMPFPEALALLWDGAVPVRAQTAPGEPAVRIVPARAAADADPCSCAAAVLCDLSAEKFPVFGRETPATLLLDALGLPADADELASMRRRLARALASATSAVVLCRPLNTSDASESQPCVAFDEVVDCYRREGAFDEGIDKATGLPDPLSAHARSLGENRLQECLAPGARTAPLARMGERAAFGALPDGGHPPVLVPRPLRPSGGEAAGPTLSASAIESYLECPLKWFALRRLRLDNPDAGFGPLEMGSFSHSVLRAFHELFRDRGHGRVDEANEEEAHVLLDAVFDERLAAQPRLKPSQNPLIPTDSFERAEAARLRENLHSFVSREKTLLPGFTPTYFELPFGDESPVRYAGFPLRGSIDRIDVNDRGQAVVIDYKGSVNGEYELASASPLPGRAAAGEGAPAGSPDAAVPPAPPDTAVPPAPPGAASLPVPHKVQALIYAQVARRLLGVEPVGALYLSYGAREAAAGVVDPAAIGPGDVPSLRRGACALSPDVAQALGATTFDALLDAVEERVACGLVGMREGDIAPAPRGKRPCEHCPVVSCELRGGNGS